MRALVLFCLVTPLVSLPAVAQVRPVWSNLFPQPVGLDSDSLAVGDLAVDANGTCYVAGTGFQGTTSGSQLVRIDAGGAMQWMRMKPNAGGYAFVALSPIDGTIVIAAGGAAPGIQVTKHDPLGNEVFSTTPWSGPLSLPFATSIGRGVVVDASGNSYVCGGTQTGPDASLDVDAFVLSWDPAGALRFATILPGPVASRADEAQAIALGPGGEIWITGIADGASSSSHTGALTFLARLDASGAPVTVTTDSASPQAAARVMDLRLDAAGQLYTLRRLFSGAGQWVETTLSRYDAAGAPLGALDFLASTRPNAFDVSSAGRIAVAGYLNAGTFPLFFASYDPAWGLEWQSFLTVPGALSHFATAVTLVSNGDVLVSAASTSPSFGSWQESSQRLLRFDAAGGDRGSVVVGEGDFVNEIPVRQVVDAFGRIWVATQTSSPLGGSVRALTQAFEPQSHSFCHGDGVQNGCPCGNVSGPLAQAGCTNSTGTSARLVDSGSASVASDTLVFTCSGMEATAIALLVEGDNATNAVNFGDGLRCFGGSILRLYLRAASGGVLTLPDAGDAGVLAQSTALGGTITAGSSRVYQMYYRDASLAFCASGGTFNLSNALLVNWAP